MSPEVRLSAQPAPVLTRLAGYHMQGRANARSNIAAGRPTSSIELPRFKMAVADVMFSLSGDKLAVFQEGLDDHWVRVFQSQDGRPLWDRSFRSLADTAYDCAWSWPCCWQFGADDVLTSYTGQCNGDGEIDGGSHLISIHFVNLEAAAGVVLSCSTLHVADMACFEGYILHSSAHPSCPAFSPDGSLLAVSVLKVHQNHTDQKDRLLLVLNVEGCIMKAVIDAQS